MPEVRTLRQPCVFRNVFRCVFVLDLQDVPRVVTPDSVVSVAIPAAWAPPPAPATSQVVSSR